MTAVLCVTRWSAVQRQLTGLHHGHHGRGDEETQDSKNRRGKKESDWGKKKQVNFQDKCLIRLFFFFVFFLNHCHNQLSVRLFNIKCNFRPTRLHHRVSVHPARRLRSRQTNFRCITATYWPRVSILIYIISVINSSKNGILKTQP